MPALSSDSAILIFISRRHCNGKTECFMNRRKMGTKGEEQALAFLQNKGYTLLKRNYHARYGEIDLIMQQGEFLVFTEVKWRASARAGAGLEAVTYRKRQNLSRAALLYIQENRLENRCARFDVVEISGGGIIHIENAFPVTP